MRDTTVRRWLAGLGATGMLVAVASPASAQAPDATLFVKFPNSAVAVDHDGTVQAPELGASKQVELQQVKVTYDLSGLTGKVTVKEAHGNDYCTPTGNTLVCELPYPLGLDEYGTEAHFEVELAAHEDAEVGDEGTLKVSFGAEGYETVSHQAKIRVAEGVDLVGGPEDEVSVRPGATFDGPVTVINAGEKPAQGVAADFDLDRSLSATQRFSNCLYRDDILESCVFDDVLEPGGTYTALLPFTLRTDTFAPGSFYNSVRWMTQADFEDRTAQARVAGTKGTAGKLALTKVNNVSRKGGQTDVDPENDTSGFIVKATGDNGADLVSLGDTVTGEVGDVVTATLGALNEGPATLDSTRGGGPVTNIYFNVPAGTTVVAVPEGCNPLLPDGGGDGENPGAPGAAAYHCYTKSLLVKDERQTFEFKLRIDEVIANASGKVEINVDCRCEGRTSDLDASNDVAQILVNPTEGGGGGGLPVTGASTGIVAGAGILLLAAGAFGFVLARRRRTRFVV
ncbi:LPXTG cell wall anchor domain-containing protein [Plantactinospora solaniradicis]|uniref:LPXTG cell wall anchor domain-containing protein n=1 Tax=Plantactinospora solaniradicis TaxID=1723736 RepID=A0ABW1KCF6_9ACTN